MPPICQICRVPAAVLGRALPCGHETCLTCATRSASCAICGAPVDVVRRAPVGTAEPGAPAPSEAERAWGVEPARYPALPAPVSRAAYEEPASSDESADERDQRVSLKERDRARWAPGAVWTTPYDWQ